jgi:hypothetical protein
MTVVAEDRLQDVYDMFVSLANLLEDEGEAGVDLAKTAVSVTTPGFTLAYIPDGQRLYV